MINKLEHLMYQAGLTAQGCWDEMDDYDRGAIERLALLIVMDCVGHVETWEKDSRNHISYMLKNHYGVGK
jgi:hypothetical protein